MNRSRFAEEQIAAILKQGEAGMKDSRVVPPNVHHITDLLIYERHTT